MVVGYLLSTMTTIKPEGGGQGDGEPDEQLITVQTPSEEQQVIMVTFNRNDGTVSGDHVVTSSSGSQIFVNFKSNETVVLEEDSQIATEEFLDNGRLRNSFTQTETVFGLEDLPTVKEIVKKTIAKAKQREEESATPPTNMNYGPVNGIYTCNICGKVYRNKLSWQNHLLTHNGGDVLMCGVCGQLFSVKFNLKAHLDIHLREERKLKRQRSSYGCAEMKVSGVYMPGDFIPNTDSTKPNIGKVDNNTEVANEEVIEDGQETDTDSLMQTPEIPHSPSANKHDYLEKKPIDLESTYIYACNICGEQYTVKEDCENHLRIHTEGPDTQNNVVKPANPPDNTKQPQTPNKDGKDAGTTIGKPKFSAYIYACNVCGKQYTNKSNCKRHMRVHTDEEKMFECEYCGKRFAQKYEVKMHARIHTGEKPFSCGVCGKTFTERGNWKRHTQIHIRPQEASPYRCGICCKGFFHAEKLQVHLQIHSGQRPFVCTVCGRRVKKIGDMYRHLRTHTGEKPYKCQVCGKGFAQNGNLKDHMKMHTGEKPHVCDLCGKDFARKVLLKDHIKNHHKGTTLQDLTEAALEEIERQEAAMEALDGTQVVEQVVHGAVVQEIGQGNVPKILSATTVGNTIVIGGPTQQTSDETELLHEEQELEEMQDVHTTLTEKELEAAQVLTVVQDGDNTVYTYKVEPEQVQQHFVVTSDQAAQILHVTTGDQSDEEKPLTVMDTVELEVQNS